MPERVPSLGSRGLHLFALCGFAFALPLLQLLARHVSLLRAHDLSAGGIGLLLAGILALPPALLWLLEAGVGLVWAGLSRAVHAVWVALLLAATALPLLHRMEGLTGDVAVAVAVGAGAFASVAYTGNPRLRRLVGFLALGPCVFAGVFLSRPPISELLFEPRLDRPIAARVGSEAPVVLVVFDELPLTSLLAAPFRIDAGRYPSFQRLAERSTWYRYASTVHAAPAGAIPALLTGRYPEPERRPVVADHPQNLFRLLAGRREMRVSEGTTRLWRPPPRRVGRPLERLRALVSDLGILYLHVLLPADLSERLPAPSHGRRGLRGGDPEPRASGAAGERMPVQDVRRLLASVSRGARPGFWYLRVELPGRPWRFLPSGRSYLPVVDYGLRNDVWQGSEWWVAQGYQRHLLQLELADRLLGELLDRLESQGLFDETLLVVTSDRGAGFWPDTSRTDPAAMRYPEDVLSVPLFVKLPGQEGGRIDRRNVESVDVVPTVAAALDAELPWAVDGCSLLDEDCPARADKRIFDRDGRELEIPLAVMRRADSLEHKLAWFAPDGPFALFRLTRFGGLLGRPVAEFAPRDDPRASIVLDRDPFTYTAARRDAMALARLVGLLGGYSRRENKAFVGVAAGGILGAVAPALDRPDGTFLFSVMLPEPVRPADAEDLELFLLEGSAEAPRLWRVPFRLENLRAALAPDARDPDASGPPGRRRDTGGPRPP